MENKGKWWLGLVGALVLGFILGFAVSPLGRPLAKPMDSLSSNVDQNGMMSYMTAPEYHSTMSDMMSTPEARAYD
ncbi:MAG: hypothetical protein PHU36_00190 [Syntrophomonadaceae bacterium]|nr:hypothetical protein [Syntrophomonadaceae bacterium]